MIAERFSPDNFLLYQNKDFTKFSPSQDQQQLQQKLAKEAEKENALRAKEKQLEKLRSQVRVTEHPMCRIKLPIK